MRSADGEGPQTNKMHNAALESDAFASNLTDASDSFVPASSCLVQMMPTGTTLTSLDFEQLDTESRVIIGIKDLQGYDEQSTSGWFDLVEGASLPKSLSRQGYQHFTHQFKWFVRRTSGGARIRISNRDAEYSVTKAPNGYLIISVPIPASMRQQEMAAFQAESTVAPEHQTLDGNTRKEILIGESGGT